jgi:hypothetical protein
MDIRIVTETISTSELKTLGKKYYQGMIKGVVDVQKKVVVFGGEYHMDANKVLLENNSKQKDVWGFNIRFDKPKDEWIEYTSLINIRPKQGNTDMEVHDEELRLCMKTIINSKIIE